MSSQNEELSQPSLKDVFTLVFKENRWGNAESASGDGSALGSPIVASAVQSLDQMVRQFRIRSINDVPCGDFYWFPLILGRFPYIDYHGYDIVSDLIDWNRTRYPHYQFTMLDSTQQVMNQADLIFCKDLILHLKSIDIAATLRNFKLSGSRFLLISNNAGTENQELEATEPGAHRNVNLTAAPYELPAPIWSTQYMALWSLDAIDLTVFDDLYAKLS